MTLFGDLWAAAAVPVLREQLGSTVAGEEVIHEPLGVAASGVALAGVIVDLAFEDQGQGERLDDNEGREVQRRGRLEVPDSVTVTVNERAENCDTFLVHGKRYWAIRIEGSDTPGGFQTVVIERTEKVATKKTRPRK